jgi:hypothetical protein
MALLLKGFDLLGTLREARVTVPSNFTDNSAPGLPILIERAQLEYVIGAALIAGSATDAPRADVADLLDTMLLYIPSAPLRQMLGHIERSKVGDRDATLRDLMRRLRAELDTRGATSFRRDADKER